jgi:uncharacterized phage protein (TIGR02218 family)
MKPTNPTLNALLASRQFYAVDLYTITLSGGAVVRYCQGQSDIVYAGNTYSAGGSTGPYFDRTSNKSQISWKIGVGNDQLVIDVIPGSATILGQPFLTAIRCGFFDGAIFELDRAFMPTYGNTAAGLVMMFLGRVAEIDAGRSLTTWTINDFRELLSQPWPRNLFQAGCVNTFGDASCGINQNDFSANAVVLPGSTTTSILSGLTNPTDYFTAGKFIFTTGSNAGLTYSVSSYVETATSIGVITPVAPLVIAPNVGDAFTIFAGCDRTLGPNGCPKFSNVANFRGFPYVPAPETAL